MLSTSSMTGDEQEGLWGFRYVAVATNSATMRHKIASCGSKPQRTVVVKCFVAAGLTTASTANNALFGRVGTFGTSRIPHPALVHCLRQVQGTTWEIDITFVLRKRPNLVDRVRSDHGIYMTTPSCRPSRTLYIGR
jgi:hypothetical protein